MNVARSSVLHVAAAFLAMGGWAVLANRAHPMPGPLVAGLVQGALSAAITLGLKRGVEALVRRLPGRFALFVPPVAAWAASAALLIAVHRLAGTPEVLATILVPNGVATVYALLYTVALWKSARLR
ncbi:MAG: hypothetical protein CVT84_01780 [Alphaproteobacteria bacterium HGW-Alphaproteobacteria-6]|nr:MAG: hypothetical protein CVT84_01780 [Alphaproteobacteria bacterium HGW-Alphaproteobacteria-6]